MKMLATATALLAAVAVAARAQDDVTQAADAEFYGDVALDTACTFSFNGKPSGLVIEQPETLEELHFKGFRFIMYDDFTNQVCMRGSCQVDDLDMGIDNGDSAFCGASTGAGVIVKAVTGSDLNVVNAVGSLRKYVISMLQPVPWIDVHLVEGVDEVDGPTTQFILYLNGQRVELVLPNTNAEGDGVYHIAAAKPHGLFDKIEIYFQDRLACIHAMALPCEFIESGDLDDRKRDVAHAPAPHAHYHYKYTDKDDDDDDDDDDDSHNHFGHGHNAFTHHHDDDDDDDDDHHHHHYRAVGGAPTFTVGDTEDATLSGSASRCVTDMQQFGYGSVWEQSPTRLPNNRGVKSITVSGATLTSPDDNDQGLVNIANDGSGTRVRGFCAIHDNAGAVISVVDGHFELPPPGYYRIDFTHPVSTARVEVYEGVGDVSWEFWLNGAKVGTVANDNGAERNRVVYTLSAGQGVFDQVRLLHINPQDGNNNNDGICIRAIEVEDCHFFHDDDDDDDDNSVSTSDFFQSEYYYYPLPRHVWAYDDDDSDDDDDDDNHHHSKQVVLPNGTFKFEEHSDDDDDDDDDGSDDDDDDDDDDNDRRR